MIPLIISPRLPAGAAACVLALWLGGCANQPAYPIAPGGSAGESGRAEATRPQYPIAPGGSAGPEGRSGEVRVPLASAPPPAAREAPAQVAEEPGPRVAAEPVEASALAPPPEAASTATPPNSAAPASAAPSQGVGYADLRRREAERAHAAAEERRRRQVAAKLKSYLPEKREPGERSYTLAQGDTLYGVGRRFGLSPKAVAGGNGLKLGGVIHPGAELSLPDDAKDGGRETGAKGAYVVIPGRVIAPTRSERATALAKAERAVPPVPDLAPEAVETAAAPPPVPVARRPSTVYSTPRPRQTAGVTAPAASTAAPARVYAPAPPTVVANAPSVERLPAAQVPATPSSPRPYASLGSLGGRRSVEAPPSSRSGGRTSADAQAAYRVAAAREAARTANAAPSVSSISPSTATAAGRGRFAWPVRGAVLSGFGPKGPGQRNDGVDIAAADGEAVKAAAPGEVVYAGHDVAALGNLVAVKHADGWVTIYANLQRITVHPRDKVGQGSQIGLAGASGDATRPQVHFEVRYAPSPTDKARPIDPQTVLPSLGLAAG